jgi:hypothetical protein
MTHYGLRISKYRACRSCTLCLGTEAAGVPAGAAAPVTWAAADEYNLNVVDCNTSVSRTPVFHLSQWGSGAYPQPPEANVKDHDTGFPWPPPGLLGFFFIS